MPYIPDATQVTEPVDGEPATTAALEFRTLKSYLRDVILAGLAGKANTLNPNFSGTVAVYDNPNLLLVRATQAGGQNNIKLITTDTGRTWQIYNQTGADDLRIFASGYGDILRVISVGDVSVSRDLLVGRSVTISGTFGSTNAEGVRIANDASYLSFYNAGNTVRSGYIQAVPGGPLAIRGENCSRIEFNINGQGLQYFGNELVATNTPGLGRSSNPWGDVWAVRYHGDGSGLTNLPAGAVTGSQVVAALGYTPQAQLGYTPYNSTNPAGYLSSINSGQVTTALGFTPYSNSNPANYISGISGGMVTAALGYTPYNSSNPSGFISSISGSQINTALGLTVGTNATGNKTVSTGGPTGTPADGDLWYQRAA